MYFKKKDTNTYYLNFKNVGRGEAKISSIAIKDIDKNSNIKTETNELKIEDIEISIIENT